MKPGDVVLSFFFFFFKQKTAYEMRISDWSSDVCSSDLFAHLARDPGKPPRVELPGRAVVGLDRIAALDRFPSGGQPARLGGRVQHVSHEIGRASCRERVCQYV